MTDLAQPSELDGALRRAQAGDETAFGVLWAVLQPTLLRFLRSRGVTSPEDVASETWLAVIKGLRTFQGDADAFRAWLFTIGRHRAIDALRAEQRRPLLTQGLVAVPEQPSSADTEGEVLERLSLTTALALIASLPEEQREAVALRAVAGLDVATTARILGKSQGSVRVAAHRGLKALATTLGSHVTQDVTPARPETVT